MHVRAITFSHKESMVVDYGCRILRRHSFPSMQLIAHTLNSLISISFVKISPNLNLFPPWLRFTHLADPCEGGAYVNVNHVTVLHTQSLK